MKAITLKGLDDRRTISVAVFSLALATAYLYWTPARTSAADDSLLGGRVTSASKRALAGIPVRAHRESSNVTVIAYTNGRGEYLFPGWSDLTAGSYSIAIELPDFEPVKRDAVMLTAGRKAAMDFTLQPRQPSIENATAAEIAMGEPGTDDQKFLLTQCSNCHTLQWALRKPHTKEEWIKIVRRMAGEQAANSETPGTRAFGQKQYIEPLADYLATIRGPGSSDQIPFKPRPRPTGEASAHLVVTEYEIPRGGSHELYMIRGDRRYVWPHDVIMDSNYAYYTDHFSYHLGRLDKKTGEAKEFAYTVPPSVGREGMVGDGRAGNPGGGAHDMAFDPEGNVVFGIGGGTAIFNPRTEKFTVWPSGSDEFGMGPDGKVWYFHQDKTSTTLSELNTKTGETKAYPIPRNDGIYGMETDSRGRSVLNIWRDGKFGLFDPKTVKYTEYPTLTPGSGPRRGEMDSKDREWVGEYWSGRLASFDANSGAVKEFPLIPDSKAYGPPFLAPYTASVDEKNQIVWASDFNSGRIYRVDMKTGHPTELYMPSPYEVRKLTADKTATRPTLWIPAYRPPSKLVKVQVW